MKRRYKFLLAVFTVGYWVGCSPVSFQKDISNQCQNASGCIYNPNTDTRDIDKTIVIDGGAVDILFVDDNSGSMSFEQNQIAARFSNFVQALDARGADYRIGIITTDVSATLNNGPRPINGNGALQDGRLINFAPGVPFITQNTQPINVGGVWKTKEQLFADTIQRPETLTCEAFINTNPNVGQTSSTYLANCPSGDERGIYSANLFLDANPAAFIRPNARLAIVFLSDEDVRSSLYYQVSNYSLDNMDLPQTLIGKIKSKYVGKIFSVHSLIVKPGTLTGGTADQVAALIASGTAPTSLFSGGDVSCLNMQGSQTANVSGSYGYLYSLATRMTQGIEGNICSTNYTTELQSIAANITDRQPYNLECSSSVMKDLQVYLNGTSYNQYTQTGNTLNFPQSLPAGSVLEIKYTCPAL